MAFIVAVATVSGEVLYSRTSVPTGWTMGKSASPSAQINFIFALYQRNVDQLERIALTVSDPDHEAYQDFWDFQRIQRLVSPPQDEQDAVIQYARSHGVAAAEIYNYGDAIEVTTSVKAAAVILIPVSSSSPIQQADIRSSARLEAGHYRVPFADTCSSSLVSRCFRL